MKRTEAKSVGEIIQDVIESDGNKEQFDRRKICYAWADVVGPTINRVTTRKYVEGRTLHVYISSAAIKSELAFMTEPLIKQLNDAVGSFVISKIAIH